MKNLFTTFLILAALILFVALQNNKVSAFQKDGCSGDCRGCHTLTKDEAAELLKKIQLTVVDLKMSEVPGLWSVIVEKDGKKIPLYIDFSKQYLISGKVIQLESMADLTYKSYADLNRVDVNAIPLDDCIVMGNPMAKNRIIVIDDPECPYCKKLHDEIKKIIAERDDIVFYIKLYPLKSHKNAYSKAQAIICAKSAQLLEDSLNGKELPAPSCETDQVDKNIKLAEGLGIFSTPTLIFPDGRVYPGFKDAETIYQLLTEDLDTKEPAEDGKKKSKKE